MLFVDLNPMTSEQCHAFARGHQLREFVLAQRFTLKSDTDIEIESFCQSDPGLPFLPQAHEDVRPGWFGSVPPIWNTDDDA